MSSWELGWEAHHCQPSWLGMSCPLRLCAFLCSPSSQNSYDSSGSSCCLPATEGDPSMCSLGLIHPPWPANVSGLSLYPFCWENLGRQLPRSKSQLLPGIYYLGRRMGMINAVGMERAQQLGIIMESILFCCPCVCVSAHRKGIAGLETALLARLEVDTGLRMLAGGSARASCSLLWA